MPHPGVGPDGRHEYDRYVWLSCNSPDIKLSQRLAAAHKAGEVPHWVLQGRELTCRVGGRLEVGELDDAIGKAVLVADLLEVT